MRMLGLFEMPDAAPPAAAAKYPDAPGYVDRDTSQEAADSIAPHISRLAADVLAVVRRQQDLGMGGATCWEVERHTGLSHQSASARIRELCLKERIAASMRRRQTGSKRNAIVWQILGPPHEKPEEG